MSKIKHRLLPRADECGPRIVDEKGRQVAEVWGTHEEALVLTAAFELRDICTDLIAAWGADRADDNRLCDIEPLVERAHDVLATTRPS